MVDKSERALLSESGRFPTPVEAVKWLIEKGLIDYKRCRVWAMRKHYFSLIEEKKANKMDAITCTAIEFCVAEDTVREAVYRNKGL